MTPGAFLIVRATFYPDIAGLLTDGAAAALAAAGRRWDTVEVPGAFEIPGAIAQAARGAETAYVITGSDLLALNHSLDSDAPAKVIFHSHPNGRAYFSPTDREVATSPWGDGPAYPVQQLVVGINGERVVEAALFAWDDDAGGFVELARYAGAAI